MSLTAPDDVDSGPRVNKDGGRVGSGKKWRSSSPKPRRIKTDFHRRRHRVQHDEDGYRSYPHPSLRTTHLHCPGGILQVVGEGSQVTTCSEKKKKNLSLDRSLPLSHPGCHLFGTGPSVRRDDPGANERTTESGVLRVSGVQPRFKYKEGKGICTVGAFVEH